MKKKLLLLNQNWLEPELKSAELEVLSVGLNNPKCDVNVKTPEIPFDRLLREINYIPDQIIYYDDSAVPWLPGLEESKISKLFYSVDTFHHHHWHGHFSAIFDAVIVAQKDFVSVFHPFHADAVWFPLWNTRSPVQSKERIIDVAFVGTLDRKLNESRVDFFEKLSTIANITTRSGDYAETYSQAKIVINQVVRGDLNFRVFEAMASGALLLTPKIENGLSDLFEENRHLVLYRDNDPRDAAEKIKKYLSDDNARRQIAAAGHELVLKSHGNEARASRMLEILRSFSPKKNPRHYLGASIAYLASYFVCQHDHKNWGSGMLKAGAAALIKSAKEEEPSAEDFQGAAAIYLFKLTELGFFDLVKAIKDLG